MKVRIIYAYNMNFI